MLAMCIAATSDPGIVYRNVSKQLKGLCRIIVFKRFHTQFRCDIRFVKLSDLRTKRIKIIMYYVIC